MFKNGEVVIVGVGVVVLGYFVKVVVWVINKLGEYKEGLKKGDIVLIGVVLEVIFFRLGDSIYVQFVDLGSVFFSCS